MVMHKIFFSDLLRVALLAIAATHLPTLTAQGSGGSSPMPIGEFPAPPAQKPNAGKELERMSKRYDLSAEQKSRIGPILVEHQSKIVGLLHDPSLAADDKASRFGEIDSEMVSKIAAILSPAQRAKFEKDEARKRDRDQLPGAPEGPPPPGDGGGPPPES